MAELLIGHMTNRINGRERVYVIIRCSHGDPDAPREFITEHSEYDRLERSQRGSVIAEAIAKHRHNVWVDHGVRCTCPSPRGFHVDHSYLAEGEA